MELEANGTPRWRALSCSALGVSLYWGGQVLEARLLLENRGARQVSGATLRVYLPRGARVPSRVEYSGWLGRPLLRVGSSRSWVDVIAGDLEPGESVSYSFRY